MKGRKCRKVLSCFLAAMLLLLTACSSVTETDTDDGTGDRQSENDMIRIGITFDTFVLERWIRDRDVFVDTAQKLGATVYVQTANGDVEKQKQQIEKFTEDNMDAIVIIATDCYELRDEITEARNKGIRVISYDRLIQEGESDLYITVDSGEVGRLMAREIKESLPDGGNIIMICGPVTDSNSLIAEESFEEEIGNGAWEIVYKSNVVSWTAENGLMAVEEAFENTEEQIDAIMCGNDGLAGYVIQSLSEKQLAGEIIVVGQDADLEACQRIVEGTQYMTVYKPIQDLAKTAAECTVALVKGETLTQCGTIRNDEGTDIPYLGIEPVAVTKDNMDAVIINSGFHSREEVYLNVEN